MRTQRRLEEQIPYLTKGRNFRKKIKKEEMNEPGNWLGMAGCGTGRRKQPSWKYRQLPCKGLTWQ